MTSFGLRLALSTLIVSCLLIISFAPPVEASLQRWEATNFCKCICFGSNYTIQELDNPANPSKPCLSCTKTWCLQQNLKICAGATLGSTDPDTATGKEGDVEARCFQRDSPRDQLVVTLYLLIVFGLLLGAGIKNQMAKAGIDTHVSWQTTWQWWQAWIPFRRSERLDSVIDMGRHRGRRADYVAVNDS